MSPTPEEIAWSAGFWEGEGWVQAWKHKPGPTRPKTYVYLQACASQKDREPLDLLQSIWGGHITRSSRIQDIWRWTLNGRAADEFFDAIWDYLSERRKAQIESKRAEARAATGPTRPYIRRAEA